MVAFYLFAIGVGLFMIAVAAFNRESWFFDTESTVIEMIGGQTAVRWYWAAGGVVLIATTVTQWVWGWAI